MPVPLLRSLIGPDAILGLSVGSVEQAERAVAEGVDYVGIGAVWHTLSKDLKGKQSLGPEGVGEIIDALQGVPSVAIGGLGDKQADSRRHTSSKPRTPLALFDIA